jgi:hypothetical protein
MPKSKYDLRRIRKIYPVKRRSPLWIDTNSELEGFKLEFKTDTTHAFGVLARTYVTTRTYTSAPVVVITSELDDVNAYVSNMTGTSGGTWTIQVTISHLIDGFVNGIIAKPST